MKKILALILLMALLMGVFSINLYSFLVSYVFLLKKVGKDERGINCTMWNELQYM